MDASLQTQAELLVGQFASPAKTAEDLNELMRLMMKSALERMLDSEMDVHLGRTESDKDGGSTAGAELSQTSVSAKSASSGKRSPNRRNGRSKKTVRGDVGDLTISTHRDRDGSFEPQLIGKHQRRVPGFDEKILALYAKGMTTRDIQEIVQELYGVEVSPTLISEITNDLDAEVTAWRTRPLDAVWPIVYFDGIVVHVRGGNSMSGQTHKLRGETQARATGVFWGRTTNFWLERLGGRTSGVDFEPVPRHWSASARSGRTAD